MLPVTSLPHLTLPTWAAATGLAAFLFGLLGVVYIALARRDEEPGLRLLGTSALLLCLFFATETLGWHSPLASRYAQPLWAALTVQAATFSCTLGLCQYLGEPLHWRRPVSLLLLPNMVLMLLLLAQVPVLRLWGNLMTTAVFVGLSALTWQHRRSEPGAGHGWIALSLLCLPLASGVSMLLGFQPVYLRYLAIPALLVFYLTVLPVSLLRRRRALEAEVVLRRQAESALSSANEQLEHSVRQRTLALQDMVSGLQSFNRSVSHDLRGPLGGIEAMAQVIRQALQRGESDRAQSLLVTVEAQARTSRELLGALLELARVDDTPLHTEEVALHTLVQEVLVSVRQQAGNSPWPAVRVGELPVVRADARLLRIILINLLDNARKFCAGAATPQIEISCGSDQQQWTIVVRDNGSGFDPAAAEDLFQPFKRLHDHRVAGHGVGLSIVRRAVERHGGQVWADARPGEGARFSFTLPDPVWLQRVSGGTTPWRSPALRSEAGGRAPLLL